LTLILIGGCGSLATVGREDREISARLGKLRTRCLSIPRLYSGVAYDFCRINSVYDSVGADFYGGFLFAFLIVDGACSFVADTLVLPYTGYQQAESGSVVIQGGP
jgi:uncharacterized protein YceK